MTSPKIKKTHLLPLHLVLRVYFIVVYQKGTKVQPEQ